MAPAGREVGAGNADDLAGSPWARGRSPGGGFPPDAITVTRGAHPGNPSPGQFTNRHRHSQIACHVPAINAAPSSPDQSATLSSCSRIAAATSR